MRVELIQQLWRDMYGEVTVKEVCEVTEYVLRTRAKHAEEDIAEIVGRFYGNLFKSRESLLALELEKK